MSAHPLTVGIGECLVSRDAEAVLATHALGSCIGVIIHDPVAHVAGLLHFMLPDSGASAERAKERPYMYADSGIPKLFHTAYALGACKPRLMVTLLGGAQVLQNEDTFNIGKRNHLAARKILWKASVMVHQEDVGGSLPRSVRVQVGSGRIIVFHGRDERELTPKGRERMALGHGV